jgi:hypothetical protein
MREELSGWRTFSGVAFYLVGGFSIVGGLAALSAMLHVAFPAFGLITIALSVLVIYGLIVPDERSA